MAGLSASYPTLTGHHVTLFASGGSATNATLVPVSLYCLRFRSSVNDPASRIIEIEEALKRAGKFDVIHFIKLHSFPSAGRFRTPTRNNDARPYGSP